VNNSFTEENYLKAIHKLAENSKTVSTSDIAQELQIRAATVTDMLKKLASKEFIQYEPYKGVSLTEKGRMLSVKIIRKHRLWELFLVKQMKFKWDEVHEIAEQLEHIQSDELIDRLDDLLGHPAYDPHGDPIPDKNGEINKQKSKPLTEINKPATLVVAGVVADEDEFLRYLDRIGVSIGSKLMVKSIERYDGSMQVCINNGSDIFMSSDVASKILVTPQ
jgi:DtxR family transcriptional regulator, Mn-dependent transcriptional regulator